MDFIENTRDASIMKEASVKLQLEQIEAIKCSTVIRNFLFCYILEKTH
jgi:hypothetical protein